MTDYESDLRKFRGGNWDLRKLDRRKEQMTIEFPDRRKQDRRNAGQEEDFSGAGLQWVDPSSLDE